MNQPASSFLRGLAERFSRGKILRRTLRTANGPRHLVVSPEASLRYWLPNSLNSDMTLCEFAYKHIKKGQKVWDLGGNVGIFTFSAASQTSAEGKVLTVEADPFMSQLLIQSSQLVPSSDARPEIVTVAISDEITLADFAIANRSRASNHLLSSTGCTQTGGVRFSFKVPCVTLDWLLENSFAPDLVKMDIEGLEGRALSSAPRLLENIRPVFHLEVWSEIATPLKDLLRSKNYLFFDGEKDLALKNRLEDMPWCTIAVPAEKIGVYANN